MNASWYGRDHPIGRQHQIDALQRPTQNCKLTGRLEKTTPASPLRRFTVDEPFSQRRRIGLQADDKVLVG